MCKLWIQKFRVSNKGISIIELAIAIAILGILTTVLVPQYLRYHSKSQKTIDLYNAAQIAKAFEMAMIEFPDAKDVYDEWNGFRRPVSVTVNGVKESYYVYGIMANKPDDPDYNGAFWGGETKFKDKSDGTPGLYSYINLELGISRRNSVNRNSKMLPKYRVNCDITNPPDSWRAGRSKVDRWRIVKRKDTGQLEVWSAENTTVVTGQNGGGYPIYRVWPVPDDVYKVD